MSGLHRAALELLKDKTPQEVKEWLKSNINYLTGIELSDHKLDAYLLYQGQTNLVYFVYFEDKLLFSGSDYKPAMAHDVDSLECLLGLLQFILTKKGHIDANYFQSYTPEQLAFRDQLESVEWNELIILMSDVIHGDDNSKEWEQAVLYFDKYMQD